MHSLLLQMPNMGPSLSDFVTFSMSHFVPETLLTAGFLLAIVLDLLIRGTSTKKVVGYFTFLVLAVAFYFSWQQFIAAPEMKQIMEWKPGTMIFPYSQTLPGGQVDPASKEIFAPYAMAVVDNFAVIFKLIIALAGMFVVGMSLLSKEVEKRGRRNGEFYALLLAMSLGMFLMPASMDLVMMYISLELVSITSYIMAGFMKDDARSTEASMKYVLFGAFSSGLMIYGFSLLYGLTGTTNIRAIHEILQIQFNSG
ncbi:MAG TPA: proton-conducting transporter membrane subunit, partial [Candidatus Kapabacteria bacterium]|nr:proton-conducting transporter membrane subunit [Candidatus Kapabacteria bacterium]